MQNVETNIHSKSLETKSYNQNDMRGYLVGSADGTYSLCMIIRGRNTIVCCSLIVFLQFLYFNTKVAADQESLKPFLFNLISVQNIHPFLGTSEIVTEQKEGVGKFLYNIYLSVLLSYLYYTYSNHTSYCRFGFRRKDKLSTVSLLIV